VIAVEQVAKRYGDGAAVVEALRDVSLVVPKGQFVSIMGPSGCGKSTLLNLVCGLDRPTRGRVLIEGEDLAQRSDDQCSDLRLRRIGLVFQSFNLFPSFTVEENVATPLEFSGVRWRDARALARRALERVGVAAAAFARRPAELSGGEQQRTAIARALVTEPAILLADEPTGNLDTRTGQSVLDLIRELNRTQKLTVLMATHSTFAATYGHRTIELSDGTVVRDVTAPARASLRLAGDGE
jgi:putative ABC transport system ATP-binding protein